MFENIEIFDMFYIFEEIYIFDMFHIFEEIYIFDMFENRVKQVGRNTVAWVRKSDSRILSIEEDTIVQVSF